MDGIISTVFDFKDVAIYLVAGGALIPACALVLVKLMALPVLRDLIGKGCEWIGVWVSIVLIKIFRGKGDALKVEDAFEDLLQTVIVKRFLYGLNKDDD